MQADGGNLNPTMPTSEAYCRKKGRADTEGTATFRSVGRTELFKPVDTPEGNTRVENIARGYVPWVWREHVFLRVR